VGRSSVAGSKLRSKLEAAGIPEDLIRLAVEMRMGYARRVRTSTYMQPDEVENLEDTVKSAVLSLRARFAAGEPEMTGAKFHSLCIAEMDRLCGYMKPLNVDRSAFIKGYLYDIADRCLLRFDRAQP